MHDAIIDGLVRGGCTATVVLFVGERGYVAHVGDSRLALVRDGRLERLTVDHRPSNKAEADAVRARGGVVLSFGGKEPRVNGVVAITRALGDREFTGALTCDPDVAEVPLRLGTTDSLVLACDGLWDAVSFVAAGAPRFLRGIAVPPHADWVSFVCLCCGGCGVAKRRGGCEGAPSVRRSAGGSRGAPQPGVPERKHRQHHSHDHLLYQVMHQRRPGHKQAETRTNKDKSVRCLLQNCFLAFVSTVLCALLLVLLLALVHMFWRCFGGGGRGLARVFGLCC